MTKTWRKAFGKYVRWCANELGLRDWTIEIVYDEAAADENNVECVVTPERHWVRLKVHAAFHTYPPEQQRNAVVHELLHVPFDPASAILRDDLEDLLGKQAHAAAYRAHIRHVEMAVDSIACAIDKHFPLPELP